MQTQCLSLACRKRAIFENVTSMLMKVILLHANKCIYFKLHCVISPPVNKYLTQNTSVISFIG